MNIHQLSVSHEERQDRLLLRLNTQDGQEFRFWLTRRMAIRLLPAMQASVVRLEAAQPGIAAIDHTSQQMLTELKRDAFLQTADFSTPYETHAQQLPLGDEPLLVTDAQLSVQPNGSLQIIFQKKIGEAIQSCQLNLQAQLVHGMIHLIRQSMEKAEWIYSAQTTEPHSDNARGTAADQQTYKH
ncbi:hypothetical protein B9Z45_13315 [Limnohabitans sp. 2KL-17]|uniref:hypothetical protein n=1 Tax=Limnohabitans sp. 2KL-17 TaxID=1100704 RepID=UPI000DD1A8BE|nr:hypothetical protein [Limnohabitans sp. 2KL-17]PUE52996.1 hypothetical protein B9Z45_13315 [Limnohabitans sp. 2KL-17]